MAKTLFHSAVCVLLAALSGCSTVDYVRPGEQVHYLTPTASFRMPLPPFQHADIPIGSQVPVVGHTERDGKIYRVVRLPDTSASLLNILINDDGSFQGDAISAVNNSRMGFSYLPDPPSVRLVPYGSTQLTEATGSSAPEGHTNEDDSAQDAASESSMWANVPCDVVVQDKREECISEHARLGIEPNVAAGSNQPGSAPSGSTTIACGHAGNGYRPIVDMQGVDSNRLECDLAECQTYASRISVGQSTAANAIAGALFGALFGLAVGDHGWAARAGAQGGAIGGAIGGAGAAAAAQTNIVRNCMSGRGYRVLQ